MERDADELLAVSGRRVGGEGVVVVVACGRGGVEEDEIAGGVGLRWLLRRVV